jgi:putative ABC transport system substrate-binding protein
MVLKQVLLIIGMMVFGGNACAGLLLVSSQESPLYNKFQKGFAAEYSRGGMKSTFDFRLAYTITNETDLHAYSLIVAAGVDAAKALALADTTGVPVIYTMLPESSYEWLRKNGKLSKKYQVLYIDQPLRRIVNLVATSLPEIKTLGFVHGEPPVADIEELRDEVRKHGMVLRDIPLHTEAGFVDSLMHDLDASDAVLVLPDPYLFNRRTVQSVLLASFRQHKPLIAYSESFVNAGALLALFSTADQIGRQTAEMAACMEQKCDDSLTTEHYPDYFSVQLNPLVARRLGLRLKSADELLHLLQAQEPDQK